MKAFYKKIGFISMLNFSSSAVNFCSNLLIVKYAGLEVFGKYVVLLSFFNLLQILFELIPMQFSLFEIQRNKPFNSIFNTYHFYTSILLLLGMVIVSSFYENINSYLFIFYGIYTSVQLYLNTILKIEGRTKLFLIWLLCNSLIKIGAICLFIILKLNFDVQLLLFLDVISIISGLYFLLREAKGYFFSIRTVKLLDIYEVIKTNNFRSYYLASVAKKFYGNSINIFFEKISSPYELGIYAVCQKAGAFLIGFIGIIETVFSDVENLKSYGAIMIRKVFFLSFILQIIYIIVTFVYTYISTNTLFPIVTVILSFQFYSVVYFQMARVIMLSNFNPKAMVYANFGGLVTITFLSIIFYCLDITDARFLSLIFTISQFSLLFILMKTYKLSL